MDPPSSLKRHRSDSPELDSLPDSAQAKRILLDILDESDVTSPSHDLDSFIKTFQDEISNSPPPEINSGTAESSESRPELGFLLEASDDELGLPPTGPITITNPNTNILDSTGFDPVEPVWGFDEQIDGYGSFEFEFGYGDENIGNQSGEYVALDGLFDHTDVGFGPSDLPWRPETLPAK